MRMSTALHTKNLKLNRKWKCSRLALEHYKTNAPQCFKTKVNKPKEKRVSPNHIFTPPQGLFSVRFGC